ncbi:MAG: hypothetical protein EP329_00510 [Deltaproteobacteria bacterium]|nr:MAG: hypothetical protein EP329_00510 [Deltaproteobacteria bacterium]
MAQAMHAVKNPKEAIYNARLGAKGRKQEVMDGAQQISNQDIIMEQLAHRGAYKGIDAKTLALWGYKNAGAVEDPESGFRAVLYLPSEEALAGKTAQAKIIRAAHGGVPPAVLAFRGTANDRGISDDTNRHGIGTYQFSSNIHRIKAMFGAAGGPVLVTGHSLGGALAQLAAAYFPGSVRRIVTFQAPAVDGDAADKIKKFNASKPEGKKIKSTHYRAEGDIVHSAGEKLSEGEVFTFHSVGIGNPLDHMQFPLARLAAARGNVIPGLRSKGGKQAEDKLVRVTKSDADKEKSEWTAKVSEWGRKAFGGIKRDKDMEPYVAMWKQVTQMAESGVYSLNRVLAVIKDATKLTEVQKVKMRDAVIGLYGEAAKEPPKKQPA